MYGVYLWYVVKTRRVLAPLTMASQGRDNRLMLMGILTFLISTTLCQDKKVKVTTILSDPFVMYDNITGIYSGYMVDVLKTIMNEANLEYEITPVPDGRYGQINKEGDWNGMLGELTKGSDVTLGPITLTSKREEHFDFSHPVLTIGVTILMNKKDVFLTENSFVNNLHYFIHPLSPEVWIATILGAILVGVVMTLFNKYNPKEVGLRASRGESISVEDPEVFSLANSLWYSFSCLVFQAYGVRPMSFGGKFLCAIWWFFCFIFVVTYITSMIKTAPFLIKANRHRAIIRGAKDLAWQDRVKFGTALNGSSSLFLEKSDVTEYRILFEKQQPWDNFVEAVQRVKAGGYAVIGESPQLEREAVNDCSLLVVGRHLDTKYFAFAFQNNSVLKKTFDLAIMNKQEMGYIHILEKKWFGKLNKDCRGIELNEDSYEPSGAPRFDPYLDLQVMFDAFGGPFILLIVGLLLSCIISGVEILVYRYWDLYTSGASTLHNEDTENVIES